ncbi:DMT family transporter [Amaricoccus sp.]|uniref:DMT family transporter n=1 Tax=Amaricoccus sp. TaxID=1872485 RepID=UPI001B78AC45|nr:DMT family transporter [Amaricoccus sp.]MBP7241413.1 DMT family transporter [Amaricoccus sp.]
MTRDRILAWAALAATLVIWASFLVSTRAAVATALGPIEIGLMRFAPAAILFAPVLFRRGPIPAGATWRDATVFALCGGVAFVFLLASGMRYAPVADAGVFAPAMLPLWVALIARFALGERIGGVQAVGLAFLVAGGLAVGGWGAMTAGAPGAWRGHVLFACASLNWAIYTVAFRRSRLAALPAAAMLAFWAAAGFLVLAGLFGTHFGAVPVRRWSPRPCCKACCRGS